MRILRGSSSSSGSQAPSGTPATPSETGKAVGGSSLKVQTKPNYGAPSGSAPVHEGSVQIAYRNITIDPDVLRVKVGSTIVWTNHDAVTHNVTSESGPQRFASGSLGEGHTFSVTLTKPGTIHYECTIHPATMNGTIEVLK